MTTDELRKHLESVHQFCVSERADYNALMKQKAEKAKAASDVETKITEITLSRKLIEEASKEAREQGRQFVEMSCTDALQQVFGTDVCVKIVVTENSQGSSADIRIVRVDDNGNYQEVSPSSEGGGMNDIIATVMQVVYGNMIPDNYAPIVLDEPSKYVSKGLAPNFAAFLKDMSRYSSKQLIIPTHDDALMQEGDSIYHIKKDGDTSIATKIL